MNSNNSNENKQLKAENKALKKEINRKDKALAETAALLGGCPKIEFVKFTPQHIAFYYLIIHCILWLIFKSLHSRTAS